MRESVKANLDGLQRKVTKKSEVIASQSDLKNELHKLKFLLSESNEKERKAYKIIQK